MVVLYILKLYLLVQNALEKVTLCFLFMGGLIIFYWKGYISLPNFIVFHQAP